MEAESTIPDIWMLMDNCDWIMQRNMDLQQWHKFVASAGKAFSESGTRPASLLPCPVDASTYASLLQMLESGSLILTIRKGLGFRV